MTNDQLRSALLDIARREVGVMEVGGNNRGPRIREYQTATTEPPGAWPWCAAWVAWCVKQWLTPEVCASMGIMDAEAWRPKTALAYGFEEWGRKRKLKLLTENDVAMPGDIVTFDFSHVGIVVKDAGSHIVTMEGNTGPAGLRDSDSGDGVFEKRRTKPLIRRLVRVVG